MLKGSTRRRVLVGLAAVAIVASACTSTGASPSAAAASVAPSGLHPAPALRRGQDVHDRVLERRRHRQRLPRGAGLHRQGRGAGVGPGLEAHRHHRNTDAAGQLQDIRDLIAKGVDAIVFNPNDPDALNPALAEAKAAGIKTVSVDAYVTDPDTYNLYNNQVKYAELGAKWLFDQLGGDGHGLLHARHRRPPGRLRPRHRVQERPQGLPEHQGRPERGWRRHRAGTRPTATKLANEFIASGQYDNDPRHLDVRHRLGGRRRDQGRGQAVRADRRHRPRLVHHAAPRPDRLPRPEGAAVTNTAAVGGAGVALALKLLNGETVTTDPLAAQPNTVLLDPVLADNLTDEGKTALQSWLVGQGLRPDLAARPADRRLDHLHPGAGRRLQGPRRVAHRQVLEPAGDAGSPASLASLPSEIDT